MQRDFQVLFVEASYLEILYKTRNMIHRGHRLLTHPLAGSLKPNQTPYKSIMLSEQHGKSEDESIVMIENCIMSAEKFLRQKAMPLWTEKIQKDFRTIDLSLMENAAKSPMLKLCV